jgi:hypothetical protein
MREMKKLKKARNNPRKKEKDWGGGGEGVKRGEKRELKRASGIL